MKTKFPVNPIKLMIKLDITSLFNFIFSQNLLYSITIKTTISVTSRYQHSTSMVAKGNYSNTRG